MSEVKVDTISERTAAGGVTIDGVLIKDSAVNTDNIAEKTAAAGVTIDGVLVKDGVATFQTASGSPLVFEGATADAFETTFAFTDPTADRTITFPDADVTLGSAAGFSKYTVVVASDSTFDLDSDTTKLIIEIQASGSTAGSTDGATYGGGGGGAGAYAKKLLTGLAGATDKLNITIGSVAGAGVSGTTTSVAQAGTASFTTITCTGGTGGTSSPGGSHGAGGAGGAVPTTGDLNIAGASGTGGQSYDSGYGPDSILGFGGGWPAVSNVGNGGAATGYGAGGGAGRGASKSGGAGSAAVVIVWEFK